MGSHERSLQPNALRLTSYADCRASRRQRLGSSTPSIPHRRDVYTQEDHTTFAIPGKQAVRAGGGASHRLGLDDAVLLDSMTTDALRNAVDRGSGRLVTEASGGITLDCARAIAATSVYLISAGWLTHSAASLDLGLDVNS